MINYEIASFKEFENPPGLGLMERAKAFDSYLDYKDGRGHLNYRLINVNGCGPLLQLSSIGTKDKRYVNFVSNDYLGFTQHPKVKMAAMQALLEFGTGSGASPAIGGQFEHHELLEMEIAAFFKREAALLYTTGYTANSATLQCLLKKEDLAILDMAVHASVYEGCLQTNVKTFIHNSLEHLEDVLKRAKENYRIKMVVVDGVYSQDGDIAKLKEIVALSHQYGAYVMVDDAHGIGVLGDTGRGLIEVYDLFKEVDLITGTFSKSLAALGGFVVGEPELIRFLKFQSRQHLFSATMTPASVATVRTALELITEEPVWRERLWANIAYFKKGLNELGLPLSATESAIIPIKIGDPKLTAEAGRLLLDAGVYVNSIIYPAVAKKDARLRTAVMASHSFGQLDLALSAFEYVQQKLNI